MSERRKTEIRQSTYAQVGDMGWREKVGGVWISDDPDFVCREPDRYEACAISAFGLYVDFSNVGRVDLARVYTSREAAEQALAHFVKTGMVP